MIAVFIDGPLAGEVQEIGEPVPVYRTPLLPPRTTVCDCDPGGDAEIDFPAKHFKYRRLAIGPKVVIYGESDEDNHLINSLKEWVVSSFTKARWTVRCRDRRAFR